jgi:hypothetical protein
LWDEENWTKYYFLIFVKMSEHDEILNHLVSKKIITKEIDITF